MKKYIKWIVCLLSFLIFLILCMLVIQKKDIYIDSFVYNYISKFIQPNLTNSVKLLTYLGSSIVVISISLFVFIFFKNKKYGFYMSINLIVITLFLGYFSLISLYKFNK